MDDVFQNDDESVEAALRGLMHHFDAVQIFATRHEVSKNGPRTIGISKGGGNYFARRGIVIEWVDGDLDSVEDEMDELQDGFQDTDIDPTDDE